MQHHQVWPSFVAVNWSWLDLCFQTSQTIVLYFTYVTFDGTKWYTFLSKTLFVRLTLIIGGEKKKRYTNRNHNLWCQIVILFECETILKNYSTVKPRFTAVFGGKEISAVNRGPR